MKVLQLGSQNWQKKYSIPDGIDWHFNDFPEPVKIVNGKVQRGGLYAVVIITGKAELSDKDWKALQWKVNPYSVLYMPDLDETAISDSEKYFFKCQKAEEIEEDPQTLIDHLQARYFIGQSGIRIFPTDISLNETKLSSFKFKDSGHIELTVDSLDKWTNIGSYRQNMYVDPNRLIKLWLEFQSEGVQIRLRLFIQPAGGDGNVEDNQILTIDPQSDKEIPVPLPISTSPRFMCVSIEVKGKGKLTYGILHTRWSREGKGAFFVGGKRIVNLDKHEDIAYYFNPGDLKPPLNVYFSGARGLEGFEAYPMFRRMHAPALLFTDMRLAIGEFYDDADNFMSMHIKQTILDVLKNLGFTKNQLIMNGISMGTYPALKYGAELGAYMINVAKPITNLGYIAERGRLERPDEFDTIFDIDYRIINDLDLEALKRLDNRFWDSFNQCDLSNTRLFIGYMKNDDYDGKAIEKLKNSPAVKKALQFSYKGYLGRHNDNNMVVSWFSDRVTEVLKVNFGRKL
ncbi:MAG: accessory Sec system protein Asp2 [Lactobacillus sp.]